MKSSTCPTCGQTPKRSKAANARYWALLREAAVATGTDVDRLHFIAACKFLGSEEVMIDGVWYRKPNGTSGLSDKEFSVYADQTQAWLLSDILN
jgi:hypothetical protein